MPPRAHVVDISQYYLYILLTNICSFSQRALYRERVVPVVYSTPNPKLYIRILNSIFDTLRF